MVKRLVPLLLVELLIGSTYTLYRFGVWVFPYQHDTSTLLYIVLYMLAFLIGYVLSLKLWRQDSQPSYVLTSKTVWTLCVTCGFLLIPYCLSRTGSFYPPIFNALQDLADAYGRSELITSDRSLLHYVAAFGRPLIYLLFFAVYYYWDEFPKRLRVIAVGEVVWFVAVDMSTGHNRGVFSVCIIQVIMYLALLCGKKQLSKKELLWRTISVLVAFLLVPLYFNATMEARARITKQTIAETGMTLKEINMQDSSDMIVNEYGYQDPAHADTPVEQLGQDPAQADTPEGRLDPDPASGTAVEKDISGIALESAVKDFEAHKDRASAEHPYYINEYAYAYVDIDSALYRVLPESLRFLFVEGSFYVSHAYHAIAIGLRQKFDSSYGIGTFLFARNIVERLTGIDFYKRTFIYKINQAGFPVSLYWGTAFIQWASDVSFLGVSIVMALLGGLTAILWMEVIEYRKFTSLIVVVPLGYYLSMMTSWWMPGMMGSDFLLLHSVLFVWILQKIYARFWRPRLS